MQAPRKPLLDVVSCTLCYMRTTLYYALFYATDGEMNLYGYTDADWEGTATDRRDTYSPLGVKQ